MTNIHNPADKFHNLGIGHCNIQGGLLNLAKSNELTQLIRDHKLDILSLNEMNLNDTIDTDTMHKYSFLLQPYAMRQAKQF